MRSSTLLSLILITLIFAGVPAAFAFETDQYNLPPKPLFDIGDEVSDHIAQNLVSAVAKVNAEIVVHQSCLDVPRIKGSKCGTADAERSRLTYLHSNDAVANEVYKLLGYGDLFVTKTGKWFRKHKFSKEPARYTTTYLESIYVTLPSDYLTISPTIRLYGSQFGLDKIEHFFQQGYGYYKIYEKDIAAGAMPDAAAKKAVKWGKMTERTYFGLLVSGVYSNADLVANYAGMKFYLGLTQPITIGMVTRPAILSLKDGSWAINDSAALHENLIKPFLSEHLNEAINPSIYAFNLYPTVRRVVKNQACPEWRKLYPELTRSDIAARTEEMALWYGEDYGYAKQRRMVSIAGTCFSDTGTKPS